MHVAGREKILGRASSGAYAGCPCGTCYSQRCVHGHAVHPHAWTPLRVPGTNKVTWGQSRTLLPAGHPGRVKPDGSVERRPSPTHRTTETMVELAREYETLVRQGDARAAADHYREHGQQTCPFHRLPYAWLAVTDGMHAVTSTYTHLNVTVFWHCQVANFMDATVQLCKGKSVPKDALGRQRARAAAAAALDEPGTGVANDSFMRAHDCMTSVSLVMCADGSSGDEGAGTDEDANVDASGEARDDMWS